MLCCRKRHREIDDEDDPEKQPATKDDLDFLASKRKKTGTTEDEKLTTKTGKCLQMIRMVGPALEPER